MATSSRALAALASLAAALLAGPAAAQAIEGPLPGPLPLFPADNWWNVDVSAAPVDPNSAAFLAQVGSTRALHPDFGGDVPGSWPEVYGMPYVTVPGDTPLSPVAFDYVDESDAGAPGRPAGYPIPAAAKTEPHWIEGGWPGNCDPSTQCPGDKHLLIVDTDHRLLFETWNTRCLPAGSAACSWRAGSGAVFSLDSDHRRPETWTSADAAGLAVLPGLVRYDEVYGPDPIRHSLRVTVSSTNGYVFPASHAAGSTAGALPMGARLRLKASTDLSGYAPDAQKIFQAMKTYGLLVADNGASLYVQGSYDPRWNNDVLNPAFGGLHASDFEVVQLGWMPSAAATPTPLSLYTLSPCRVLDTRDAPGAYGAPALWPLWERTYSATGACGIPPDARAISGNVTVVLPGAAGNLRLFPGNVPAPQSSSINFRAGQVRANNLILGLSPTGSGTFTIANDSTATLDVIVDVNGYFR